MSDMYEGVVLRSDKRAACQAFASLSSKLRLRLIQLAPGVFGIYRVAGRAETFEPQEVERVAKQLSSAVKRAVALFYDNQCCLRSAILYSAGRRTREFGDGDAWWVPYGPDGKLVLDGPRFRVGELRPDQEYDCVLSAIEAALESIGAYPRVSGELLIKAFCYGKRATLAESGSFAEPGDNSLGDKRITQ
jgi:hypothetical protein